MINDLDLRVGTIVEAREFSEARKPAYQLRIDVGPLGQMTSSAQITSYALDELPGKQVVVAVNLAAKRIAGFKSECLVIAAVDKDSVAHLLSPDPGSENGDQVA